jgi:hypothetical protein
MDIRSAQKQAWQNKVVKGFNTIDIPLEFCLLQGEIAEAFDAWRKGSENLGEELADVAIYLLGLAEMTPFLHSCEDAARFGRGPDRLVTLPDADGHPAEARMDKDAARVSQACAVM